MPRTNTFASNLFGHDHLLRVQALFVGDIALNTVITGPDSYMQGYKIQGSIPYVLKTLPRYALGVWYHSYRTAETRTLHSKFRHSPDRKSWTW